MKFDLVFWALPKRCSLPHYEKAINSFHFWYQYKENVKSEAIKTAITYVEKFVDDIIKQDKYYTPFKISKNFGAYLYTDGVISNAFTNKKFFLGWNYRDSEKHINDVVIGSSWRRCSCINGNTLEVKCLTRTKDYLDLSDMDVMKKQLKEGFDIEAIRDPYGTTALLEACHEGDFDVIDLLLENGANPLAVAQDDDTAIMQLAVNVFDSPPKLVNETIDKFIKLGVDINAKNVYGNTAADEAEVHGEMEILNHLKKRATQ